jgi:hypothetical protein
MAIKGSLTTLKLGGSSTAMTGEATTDDGSHKEYQITNAAKRALDPGVALTVKKNGVAVTSTDYSVIYPLGKIVFPSALLVTDVVTVDGSFRALVSVAEGNAAEMSADPGSADVTVFGDTGPRKIATLPSCSVRLDHLHLLTDEITTGLTLASLLDESAVFLEVDFGAASRLSGWFRLKARQSASVESAVSGTVEADGVVQACVGRPTTDQAMWTLT